MCVSTIGLECERYEFPLRASTFAEAPADKSDARDVLEGRNLFARQSRFHLVKLVETIALHAYATNI